MTTRPASDNPMIGAVLGNYRILEPLSSGGMGTVYRARHEILGRFAAVKLLRPELAAHEQLVQRFWGEARAASSIRHPGIVEVYDFGYTPEGDAYFVMEYLEGQPLARALARLGRFSELEAVAIARGIASALKAAHGKGIFHRDLKPDNVFLVPDLEGPTGATRAKVLDFGVAKLVDIYPGAHRTQTGVLMGTPAYMAPEQARAAGEIDGRADLYSLGCILYELLVGKPPFVAVGAGEIIAMQLFAEPVPPRVEVPDVSPELERIVLRLLAKEPHDRFQSAGELVGALDALVGRQHLLQSGGHRTLERTTVDPDGATPGNPARARRSALPIVAAAITLLVIGGVVAAVMLSHDSAGATDPGPTTGATEAVRDEATPAPSNPAPSHGEPPLPDAIATAPAPAPAPTTEPTTDPARPRDAKPKRKRPRARQGAVSPDGSPIFESLDGEAPKPR
jgi:eukaryotic-like serine/threonine-protein kinase